MSTRGERPDATEPARSSTGPSTEAGGRARPDATEEAVGRRSTEVSGPSADQRPSRFGSYEVVRRLATGGMGELLLARQAGIEGFEREVAIKTLLPHMNDDREFVTMFLDEARLVARLSHPNIVQVLELGEAEGRYFIAMEFVDGVNLADLLIEAGERGHRGMPLAAALPIAIDVCSALHYAHERRDRFGEPLHIVHRDVSPHNVLVGFDGTVKLTDFGVATADNKVHRTRTGTVKGKMTFMSPEQATARPVDRRSDVFAFGIVLYVMLTGAHPFEPPEAADERDAGGIQTLLRILNEPAPNPRRDRPELPRKLAKVVLKALGKEPAQRHATAAELRAALEDVAVSERIVPSRDAVAAYLASLLPDRVADFEVRSHERTRGSHGGVHPALELRRAAAVQSGEVPAAPPPSGLGRPVARRRRGLLGALAAALAALALAAGAGYLVSTRARPAAVASGAGGLLALGPALLDGGPDGAEGEEPGEFEIVAWSEEPDAGPPEASGVVITFDGGAEGEELADEAEAGLAPLEAGPGGTLSVRTNPSALVQLGRHALGWSPLEDLPVPPGSHELRLRSGRLGLDYTLPDRVVVRSGERVDLGLVTVAQGSIRLAVYPWARVALNGRSLGSTPLAPILVYPGSHRLALSCGAGSGERTERRLVRVRPRHSTVVRHRFVDCR